MTVSIRRVTRVAAAPLALAVGLTLTACGSTTGSPGASGSTGSAGSAGSAGSSQTAAAPGAKVGDTVSLATLGAASTAAIKAAKTGHASMEVAGQGTMEMDMDYVSSNFGMTMTSAEGKMEMLKVGKVLYMGGMPDLPEGKKWIKISGDATDPMSAMFAPMLEQMSKAADPSALMDPVTGVDTKVTAVDGGSVTYETSLTAAQMAEMSKKALEKLGNGAVPSAAASAAADATGSMTMVQTFDAKGLPTKAVITTETKGKKEVMTVTYSKWGEAVSIVEPPAAEVTSFAEMMKG